MKILPKNGVIILLFSILFGVFSYLISKYNIRTTSELSQIAEKKLNEKEEIATIGINNLIKYVSERKQFGNTNFENNLLKQLQEDEGISYYVYKNDSLSFWSDNKPAVDLYLYANETKIQLIKIRNGWYEYIRKNDEHFKNYSFVALISIKPEFDFENRYLNNQFSKWLELPENTSIRQQINFLPHAVKSKFGPPLFEIYRDDGLYVDKNINTFCSVFALFSFLFFYLAIYILLKHNFNKSNWGLLFIILFLVGIRSVMIYFGIPNCFYSSKLYDPKIFADASSFYFSYLGDVFLNSILLFSISIQIYKTTYVYSNSKVLFVLLLFVRMFFIVFFSIQISLIIHSLVYNSTISYNINELFHFSIYSLIGVLSIGFLFFAYFLYVEKVISEYFKIHKFSYYLFFVLAIYTIISVIVANQKNESVLINAWPVLIILIIFFFKKFKSTYNFINVGLIILLCTFIISFLLTKYEKINKKQTYEAISQTLTDRQDVVAENEFNKISNSIKNDIKLKNLLSLLPLSNEQIEQSIRQTYFSGYFERYEIVLSLFKNDCTPVFTNLNAIYLNEDYFKEQIKKFGIQTICDELFFIDIKKKAIRYVAIIPVEDISHNPDKTFHLYLQLVPKQAVNLGAFPDLLLDKSLENKLESKQISYAVYESGKLSSTFGQYQYPLFFNSSSFQLNEDKGVYSHYNYKFGNQINVVITEKDYGLWGKFTSISYLFILFSLLVLIIVWFNLLVIKRNFQFNSLNTRIQFILVSVVILSSAAVVIGTIWVVNSQFESKNEKELVQKSQSVLRELEQSIGQQQSLDAHFKDNVTYRLKKLSLLFGSDISLFSKNGILYATSQPALYEQGLLSKFINPNAFSNLLKGIKANYSQKENIGKLNYLSAYIPFYSDKDQLLGYVNLPYFSRQKDLEKELAAYLTTLINIYTILFVLTTLTALLLSNLLTKPLRIIKQQISNLQFGQYNAALHWKSKDEIGNLVEEYNNMLVKLEKSSELLAKSERETAWREMAKQVAHEIKNPLTPMKLNIQHLQRVAETHPDDMNERVMKVSKILIEQIDILSHIATEFSNFAKLPNENLEILNISEILNNVTDLFKQNSSCNIEISCEENLFAKVDKEQCIRLFTNLLKNAEQSIPESKNGIIIVSACRQENNIVLKIKDNGVGIPDELKHKLFTPNFTTKSTGTGLGLAMVKNSIVSFGGTISFESEISKGTTFVVLLPFVS